jgi:hypothetical protein
MLAQRSGASLNAHTMCSPQINCYHSASGGCQSFTFYILSKGQNAGQPQLLPWVNSFAVHCQTKEELDFYFWLSYSLWQTGRFRPYLRGSVIPFLSVSDTRQLLCQVSETIYPHWQHLLNVIEALNKLKTAREHLAQCIIANEKLQAMLLKIHF